MALSDRGTRGGPLDPVILAAIEDGLVIPVSPGPGAVFPVTPGPGAIFDTDPTTDWKTEVGLGNIPGFIVDFVFGLNRNVPNALADVWGAASDIVLPVVGEQWEIVSTSANDAFGGTGANLCVITYLDTNYNVQAEVKVMNGLVAVPFVATDSFRPDKVFVISSGTVGSNDGDITVRVVGAGVPRNFMFANFSISLDGHFTVPDGNTALVRYCEVNAGRGSGIEFRLRRSIGPTNTFGVALFNDIFQNIIATDLPFGVRLTARTDVIMSAVNTAGGANNPCFAVCQMVLQAT